MTYKKCAMDNLEIFYGNVMEIYGNMKDTWWNMMELRKIWWTYDEIWWNILWGMIWCTNCRLFLINLREFTGVDLAALRFWGSKTGFGQACFKFVWACDHLWEEVLRRHRRGSNTPPTWVFHSTVVSLRIPKIQRRGTPRAAPDFATFLSCFQKGRKP